MIGGLYPLKKSLKNARTPDGFTIVETLIVLAITGVLFVSIIGITAGRQSKAQFKQAINNVKQEIEQTISEVQSGYYPQTDSFSCAPLAGGGLKIDAGAVKQGANNGCVFMGKALQFGKGYGEDPEQYAIYSVAGKQYNSFDDMEATRSFADSFPTVVDVPSVTDMKRLQNGLVVKSMYADGESIGAVAFVSSIFDDAGSAKGSQSTQVVPITLSNLNTNNPSRINSGIGASYANRNPSGGVQICFNDGGDRSALIVIGGSRGMNSVTLTQRNTADCT